MRTHKIPPCKRKSKRYTYTASCHGAMTITHLLELALPRIYFMVPKVFEPLKFDCNGSANPHIVDSCNSGGLRYCMFTLECKMFFFLRFF